MPNFESPIEDFAGSRVSKATTFAETADDAVNEPSAPVREGLPPGYRMRAEPHYVDLLASRASKGRERVLAVSAFDAPPPVDARTIASLVESIKQFGVLQPLLAQSRNGTYRLIAGRKRLSAALAAGLRDVPCVVFEVDDEEASRIADAADVTSKAPGAPAAQADLAQALTTLGACANLLSSAGSEISRAVVGNLIQAEAWRASCLLHATRIVRHELAVVKTAVSPAAVLARVERGFVPERRVRAVWFDVRSDVPHGSFLAGDERMLEGAVCSAVLATLPLVEGSMDVRLGLSVALDPLGHVTFSVSQQTAAAPDGWVTRAFDEQWAERVGGTSALVAMLAVGRTADAHGGSVQVTAVRGTRIALTVPTGL